MALRKYHGTHKLLHNALQIATKAVKACEELLGTSKPKGRPDTDEGWQEWGAKVSTVGGFQKCEARLRCVFLGPPSRFITNRIPVARAQAGLRSVTACTRLHRRQVPWRRASD